MRYGSLITARLHTLQQYLDYNSEFVDGCLLWTGPVSSDGYGRACFDSVRERAHRMAYRHYYGDFPKELHILHTCDNPLCISHQHLTLGTNQDNVQDKVNKGRHLTGERIGNSKLTTKDVLTIRQLRQSGRTLKTLAEQFHVSTTNVSDICRRKIWRHL